MKVLHITPSYLPAYRFGGPIWATHGLCKTLVKKNVKIQVLTTNVDYNGYLNIPIKENIFIDNVPVIYYPVRLIKFYYFSPDLSKCVKRICSQYDLVHLHSVFLYPTFIAAYWCRVFKISYILDPFGALDPDMITMKNHVIKRLYIHFFENQTIKNAALVNLASRYEEEQFLKLGIKTRTAVVARGIDIDKFSHFEFRKSIHYRYPQLKGKKILLFFGRIHPKKGFDILAEGFKRIIDYRKDVYLVVVGPDEDGYLSKVKRLFVNSGIIENVIFTGMMLDQDKYMVLSNSDIFILPSKGENFGITVLEAMASKLPVVITNKVGIWPDVERYKAGIVIDYDSFQLSSAVIRLLMYEELRVKLGNNGFQLVKEKYTWDRVADDMIDVYEAVLREKYNEK